MPLTDSVSFKAILQKGNRVQIPRLIRWEFKLEPTQVLKITVEPADSVGEEEEFYGHMNRDGRITIPKLVINLLKGEEKSLQGYVFEVHLEPAKTP